jgi:hypothetical protein
MREASRRRKVAANPLRFRGANVMSVHGEIKGDKLILTIDMSQAAMEAAQPSKSGKTRVLASTNGFTRFGNVGVSLNCTLPLAKA